GRRPARTRTGTARSRSARTVFRPPLTCSTRPTPKRRCRSAVLSTRSGDLMTKATRFPFPPFTRRRLLKGALAAGALTGLPARLVAERGGRGKPDKPRFEQRDFFFNLAHETEHATARYYLVAGGTRVRLQRVQDNPGVLKHHRNKNRFLQGVPDD